MLLDQWRYVSVFEVTRKQVLGLKTLPSPIKELRLINWSLLSRSLLELDTVATKLVAMHIAIALLINNSLQTLNISLSRILLSERAEFLGRALAFNMSLQKLNICTEIGDNGIAHIAIGLQTNTTLRTLNISQCNISDEGAESLARALAVNSSLQELDISFNKIGDNGIAHIATALQTNTTLRTLDISWCIISSKGAESLARALAVNRSLQELKICSKINIGDNGIAHIATALQTNTTMRTLDTVGCDISEEGAKSLVAALVNTSIETLILSCPSAHPDSTLEKIGECIDNNNVLRELNFNISQVRQGNQEFLQLVEAGGKKFIWYLKNSNLQHIALRISNDIFTPLTGVHQALRTEMDTVNSVRRSNGLLDINLEFLYTMNM